ncbi:hypothetical protein [Paracoccus sp. IB05]|uniref:hypothetical protein n=1 Tax=Paracoccus sp. IB05 TaxID=2779367 RepID=UPI0018E8197D|nr:hypothetical protein [Paracoccus sp. IB05]MBJ2152930.1 hypothetical protein [Paracoccus sp. IB05]
MATRLQGCSFGIPDPGFDGSGDCRDPSPYRSGILGLLGGAALFWALAVITAGSSVAATPWPFEGVWDCEVGTFTFTGSDYDSGEAPMPIVDIAPEGDTFTLTFEDNYQLSLAMNPDGTMTWFSPVSGDSFLCRRTP